MNTSSLRRRILAEIEAKSARSVASQIGVDPRSLASYLIGISKHRTAAIIEMRATELGWIESATTEHEAAPRKEVSEEDGIAELRRLLAVQIARGVPSHFISHAYRGKFGVWPSKALRIAAGVPVRD